MNSSDIAAALAEAEWSIAIFAARETPAEVLLTLKKAVAAATQASVIDIVVNGNQPLLDALLADRQTLQSCLSSQVTLRLWRVAFGNKAHAWNQYVEIIWPGTRIAFFVDGYVQVQADNLQRLAESLTASHTALAASGFPMSGRTSRDIQAALQAHGGLHGNLFAIRQTAMQALRQRKIRLPLGLYGFDTVLGGFLGYGLNPQEHAWDLKRRVTTEAGVHWLVREKHWWNPDDLRTQMKRILNNALRALVRKATTYYLRDQKRLPETLPSTIEAYVMEWAASNRGELRKLLLRTPLSIVPYLQLRQARARPQAEIPPLLAFSYRFPADS